MVETLMVKCKSCEATFPSPLQMDRQTFTDARPGDMQKLHQEGKGIPDEVASWHSLSAELTCPSCGATSSYEKPDYFFP
jgi:rubredoxin